MGRIDLNVNPVHIRFRNKATGKMRWMRCREYSIHGDRVAVTIIRKGHQISEWLSLNEWQIERTDAPEGAPLPQATPAAPPVETPVLTFTPRGSENPNAPASLAEALSRRDDIRKAGSLTTELPGEYNAWAHLNKNDALNGKVLEKPEDIANLQASIAAEVTRQEAMRKLLQNKARRQMAAAIESGNLAVEPG